MLQFILAVFLALVVLAAVTLQKTYYFLPAKELKRQAEAEQMPAVLFWRAVAYGSSLRLFLWLVIGFAAAACVLLLGSVTPPLLAFIAVLLLLLVCFAWLPGSRLTGISVRLSELLTPGVAWLVGSLDPVLRGLRRYVDRRQTGHIRTGIFVREDLLDLIEKQKSQHDNQLTIEELDLASHALRFNDLKVRGVMTGRKKVHSIAAGDSISPVFLDELHKLGDTLFPVYEDDPNVIVGLLQLADLTDVSKGKGTKGLVRTHMNRGVVFVHENDTLADALHAYYLTKKPMFVVINKFEEYVGILTLDTILHQLLGKPSEYDFDRHEDRTAVAAKHNKKPEPIEEMSEDQPDVSTSPEEVVE